MPSFSCQRGQTARDILFCHNADITPVNVLVNLMLIISQYIHINHYHITWTFTTLYVNYKVGKGKSSWNVFPGPYIWAEKSPLSPSLSTPICNITQILQVCLLWYVIYLLNSNSHEIKRHLFLGRKAITNLYSILKSRDIIFPAAAAAKSLQSCLTLCDPIDGSPPGSLMPGFSRQEHWSGLPFPSPMHKSEKWKWSRSDPTLSDPMDCSLPGSSIHGIFQARVLQRSV